MYLLVRANKIIDYCEHGYLCLGDTVVCEDKGTTYENCTIVYTDKDLPLDIDSRSYEYIQGNFIKIEDNRSKYIFGVDGGIPYIEEL